MRSASRDYIIQTVFNTNILPVISECNTACVFCSHKYNPEGVEVFRMPRLGPEDFREFIEFLSPNKKIIIGESATRIIEGEPLLHKDFKDILILVRGRFAHTTIQITTNAILLDETWLERFISLGNIELNISVNCVNPVKRVDILGLRQPDDIKEKIRMLKGRIKYSGSCVYVPNLLSAEDLEELVSLLDENDADAVRVFLPGYTSKAKIDLDFFKVYKDISVVINRLRCKYNIPIVIEPSVTGDIHCNVEGVVQDSPAFIDGIKIGDIILSINHVPVKTRVHGFNLLYELRNPVLELQRAGERIEIVLHKSRNSSPGIVLLYDADPEMTDSIVRVAARHQAQNVLFMTSELAFGVLNELLAAAAFPFRYSIVCAKNLFFGGTIKCAGLLTVQDVLECAAEYLKNNDKPELIMLPPIMFDNRKRDLCGRNIREIEEKFGIAVDTI